MKNLVAVSLLLLLFSPFARAQDWPRWRGPEADSIAREEVWSPESLNGSPKILWEKELGRGYSIVTVMGDRVYTAGNDGANDTIYCLNFDTGATIWTHSYPCKPGGYAGPRATPVTDGQNVYFISRDGDVYALKAATGEVLWTANVAELAGAGMPKWGHSGSAFVAGNHLLINAADGGLALDKNTGRVIWKGQPGMSGYASPVIFKHGNDYRGAFFAAKELLIIDPRTGRRLLAFPWTTRFDVNAADPVVEGGKAFVSSAYGTGCVQVDISGPTARELWRNKGIASHFGTPVLLDGALYGCDGSPGKGNLVSLDWQTGETNWSQPMGFHSLMAADGKLIIATERGEVVVAEANKDGYKELARGKVFSGGKCWTMPVLVRSRLFVRNDLGRLVCLDAR